MKKKIVKCTLIHCEISVECDEAEGLSIIGLQNKIKQATSQSTFSSPKGVSINLGHPVAVHIEELK